MQSGYSFNIFFYNITTKYDKPHQFLTQVLHDLRKLYHYNKYNYTSLLGKIPLSMI